MCETSKSDACFRVWRTELMMLRSPYWTGMDQPAKGTMRPPWARWKSCSTVEEGACKEQEREYILHCMYPGFIAYFVKLRAGSLYYYYVASCLSLTP